MLILLPQVSNILSWGNIVRYNVTLNTYFMSAGYSINNDEPTVVIFTDEGLKELLKRYRCKSKEDLDDLLWYDYGVTLIDNRKH